MGGPLRLRRCFDSIRHDLVLKHLSLHAPPDNLEQLIVSLLQRYDSQRADLPTGLPQGSPLSPLLANLVLADFDFEMFDNGTPVVRFADDFTLVAQSEQEAQQVLEQAQHAARRLDMQLENSKTRLVSFDEGFAFLGEAVGPSAPTEDLRLWDLRDPPERTALIVTDHRLRLSFKDGQLRARRGNEEVIRIPTSMLNHLVLFGPVALSAGLRSHLLWRRTPVVLLSLRGRWLGTIESGHNLNAKLRRSQLRFTDASDRWLPVAKAIVAAKITNQRTLLMRYARRDRSSRLVGATKELLELHDKATVATERAQLLGYEGAAARTYFASFGYLFPDDSLFQGRSRRPPRDPGNALLSLGYTLLTGEATGAIAATGLDPSVGVLHADGKRPSAALDLIEEFRPLIVDSVVVEAFRRGIVGADDFSHTSGGHLRASDEAKRRFIEAYERRMLRPFHHLPTGRRISYRRALLAQAFRLRNLIAGRADHYEATLWR